MVKSPFFKHALNLSNEALKQYDLQENCQKIIKSHEEKWNQWIENAASAYENLDFSECARNFRKLAKDMKLVEKTISTKGNYSDRNSLNDLTGKQWIQHTKSWLVVDGKPGSLSKEIKNHPASFPPALAEHFISFFTKKGEWVLDPFLGIGSTMIACQNLDRKCLGFELNHEYAEYSKKRCKILNNTEKSYIVINDDARNAIKHWEAISIDQVKLVITSPPYWNMLKKSRGGVISAHKKRIKNGLDEFYSQEKQDLGNINDVELYLKELTQLFENLKVMLAPNAYLIIILQNCRPKDGVMMPLAWDFAHHLKSYYKLRQEYIWCQDQKFAGIWGFPTTYVSNVHHHYCLVFQNV